ncbi:MAG: hypothetical protein ACYC9K_03185 [Sulfuricaulis sp.]
MPDTASANRSRTFFARATNGGSRTALFDNGRQFGSSRSGYAHLGTITRATCSMRDE